MKSAPDDAPGAASGDHTGRGAGRRLAILGAVLAALLALGVLGILFARPVTERLLANALGTRVSIGGLSIDPRRRTVTATQVAVGTPDGQLSVARLAVTIDLRRLLRGQIVADDVSLAGVSATVDVDLARRITVVGLPMPGGGEGGALPTAASARDVMIHRLVATDMALSVHHVIQGTSRTVPVHVAELKADDLSVGTDGSALRLAAAVRGNADEVPLTARISIAPDGATPIVDVRVDVGSVALPLRLVDLPPAISGLTGTLSGTLTYRSNPRVKEEWLQVDLGIDRPRLSGRADTWMAAHAVRIERLRADLAASALDLGAVALDAPSVGVSLLPHGSVLPVEIPTKNARGPAAASAPWTIVGGLVQAQGGSVTLLRGKRHYTMAIESARWDGIASGGAGSLAIDGRPEDGGTIAVSGTAGIEPAEVALTVTASDVALAGVAAVVEKLPLEIARGMASGSVTISGPLERVRGQLEIRQVHTAPPVAARPDEVLACDRVDAEFSIDLERREIEIALLELHYPYIMVQRSADGVFPNSAFDGGATEDSAAAQEKPMAMRIEKLQIDGGRADFLDRTVVPNYWTALAGLAAAAGGIVLPGPQVGDFDLTARQDEINPVVVRGKADGGGWRVEANFKAVFLPTLNVYLAPFLGYEAESGILSLEIDGQVATNALRTDNQVTLRNVSMRQTGLDIIQRDTGVPLPIALALLADRTGAIELAVPLRGDPQARRFELGSLVNQAISKAIVGALSSPLKLLGLLFGTKGPPRALAVDPIPFVAGSSVLDPAAQSRLQQIARILAAHTELTLVSKPEVSAQDVAMVGEAGLQELAAARAAAVTEALVGGSIQPSLAAQRLVMVPWKRAPDDVLSERSGVYVELQLSADYRS